MAEEFPIPLGARKVRKEHNQSLVGIPTHLVARWALGRSSHLYWTLVDDRTAMLSRLEPELPGRPFPHDDPRREPDLDGH